MSHEGNIDDVRYIYIKVSPSPTGGVVINYRNEPCRGSFPCNSNRCLMNITSIMRSRKENDDGT